MYLVQFLLGLLPASSIKNRMLSLTSSGWRIDASAHVGPNLFWRVRELYVAQGAAIRTANAFRRLNRVELGENVVIGQLNWFSGEASSLAPELPSAGMLVVRAEAAITSRHRIDCSGGFTLGPFGIVGGYSCVVLSHGPDVEGAFVTCAPVSIGAYTLVSTSCVIVAGITIAERVVVGAGSIVVRDLTKSWTLYGGAPAIVRRDLTGSDVRLFTRSEGLLRSKSEVESLQAAASNLTPGQL